ncbi:hypothetical protein COV17_03560 [Candidatus Woesearchaeota archaeon CG10_big_fil_rev_8_21_14_0_10_36_11]|nr:MAG: hypothetical protein COV17_03560 [Candidatus Woesearchaeota archaeon CG10_big_fil_rev_8_21_14_0_10_36_11]
MNTTLWIQLLGIIFGIAMIYFTYVKYKRKELNSGEFITWTAGWIILGITAISPSILDPIIDPLNFYRRLDFFVVFGFFILLALGFYNYSKTKKLEHKLKMFVRKQALQNAEEYGKEKQEVKQK